jgi:hypothetical protein
MEGVRALTISSHLPPKTIAIAQKYWHGPKSFDSAHGSFVLIIYERVL